MKKKEAKTKKSIKQLSKIKIDIAGVLHYKEYVGSIGYDAEENVFYGKVLYINDAVLFSAESIEELSREFENSVEDYLEMCKNEGVEPNKPMSGVFNVRISPENHYCLSVISNGIILFEKYQYLTVSQYSKSVKPFKAFSKSSLTFKPKPVTIIS